MVACTDPAAAPEAAPTISTSECTATVGPSKRDLYDNPVVIRDDQGKVVFAGRTDGPYFLARLPAGHYTVSTHWDSWTFTKPVTIGPDRSRVVFEWKKLPRTHLVAEVANG